MTNLPARVNNRLTIQQENGLWRVNGFTFSECGLETAEPAATAEDAEHCIEFFERIEGVSRIAIGDLLNWVERARGVTYKQVAQRTGYAPHSLYEAKSIMSRVPKQNRRAGLLFADYAAVAHIDDVTEQATWIDRRVNELKSARQLSATIYGSQHAASDNGESINACPQCGARLQVTGGRIIGVLE